MIENRNKKEKNQFQEFAGNKEKRLPLTPETLTELAQSCGNFGTDLPAYVI